MADFIEMMRQVEKDIFTKIGRNINMMLGTLDDEIKIEMEKGLKKAKHYDSLCNGKLAEDFGFPDGQGYKFADSVVEAVLTSLKITPSKTLNNITVDIVAYRTDLSDALSSTLSSYKSKGGSVDWLTWLLLRGNDVIIKNWGVVKKGVNSKSSRSGKAVMAPVPSPLAISFSVRGDLAGTKSNNWITEAANISRPEIIKILNKFMEAAVKI